MYMYMYMYMYIYVCTYVLVYMYTYTYIQTGAAILGAAASGIDFADAVENMSTKPLQVIEPDGSQKAFYDAIYEQYLELAKYSQRFTESMTQT